MQFFIAARQLNTTSKQSVYYSVLTGQYIVLNIVLLGFDEDMLADFLRIISL